MDFQQLKKMIWKVIGMTTSLCISPERVTIATLSAFKIKKVYMIQFISDAFVLKYLTHFSSRRKWD